MLFFRPKRKSVDVVIVGLGNPGPKYAHTRHNLGFEVVNRLAKEWTSADNWRQGKDYFLLEGKRKGKSFILLKPTTFMNLSGNAIRTLARKYEFDIDRLIVVHDELDVQCGKVKWKSGGSSTGHKGVASIIGRLGAEGFHRVKLGVGLEGMRGGERYLLEELNTDEWQEFLPAIEIACKGLDVYLEKGVEDATRYTNTMGKHLVEMSEEDSARDGD